MRKRMERCSMDISLVGVLSLALAKAREQAGLSEHCPLSVSLTSDIAKLTRAAELISKSLTHDTGG